MGRIDLPVPTLPTDFLQVKNSLFLGADINISGATRLFLIPSENINTVAMNTTTGVVTNISTYSSWSVFNNLSNLAFETKFSNTRNGQLYDTTIQFTIPGLSTIKNKVVFGLTNSEYTCILQDNNDNFWLLGADKAFNLTEAVLGTASNGYTVKLVARELKPLLQVAPTVMQNLSVNGYADSPEALQAINLSYLSVPASTASTGGGTSMVFPVNNATVGDGVGFVLITSGNTVKLPANPTTDREITFKDGGNGGTTPSIIKGNGKTIEGETEADLNTNGGAFTLKYVNGEWKIKGWANI